MQITTPYFKIKRVRHFIIIIFFVPIFNSCTIGYNITVNKDGSASTKTGILPDIELEKYLHSSIISNKDSTAGFLSFDISNIDLLGNYLPYLPKGFIQFHMSENSLSVTDGNWNSFEQNESICCHIVMSIKFEKSIQEFNSVNKCAKQKDKNSIMLSKSKNQLRKDKKKINIIVKT